MRQLRKVAVTQHSLPYQHLLPHHPETHKETDCCSAGENKPETTWRWNHRQSSHWYKPGRSWAVSNRIVTTCISFWNTHLEEASLFCCFFFLFQSTERFLRFRTADTHTHTHARNVETPKQGKTEGERRFPFQNVQRWCFLPKCPKQSQSSVSVMCKSVHWIKEWVRLLKICFSFMRQNVWFSDSYESAVDCSYKLYF